MTVECPEGATTLYCSILLADDDHDGVPDGIDNCTDVTNPDQADSDGDGVGDACEAGALPNIPDTPGTPDVPDVPAPGEDSDGDGVLDSEDNCPTTANPDQADSNGDGAGDACEEVVVPEQPDEPEPSDPPIETPEQDSDGDGVPDVSDGCPTDAAKTSAGQCGCGVADTDSDGDGVPNCKDGCPSDAAKTSAGKCGCGVADTDSDGDGVPNCKDNCPNKANANQADYNSDGVGDACTTQNGTVTYPFIISPPSEHYVFTDVRDTSDATSDAFDTYPPTNTDESGKEFIYAFKVSVPTYFAAEVQAPEPSGVDIDLQILSSLKSAQLLNNDKVNRDDKRVTAKLQPGVYYLTADSYAGKHGEYVLDATFRPVNVKESDLFNSYILKAVDRIEKNWSMLGYASAAFTHDLNYGGKGTVTASNAPYTMCVAAATEVLLVAMQIYAEETGDTSVWDFLPVSSGRASTPPTSAPTSGATTTSTPTGRQTRCVTSAWARPSPSASSSPGRSSTSTAAAALATRSSSSRSSTPRGTSARPTARTWWASCITRRRAAKPTAASITAAPSGKMSRGRSPTTARASAATAP